MLPLNLNIWAILVATVLKIVVGSFWYSGAGLGGAWMRAAGRTDEDVSEGMSPLMIVLMIVWALVSALVLAMLLSWTQADTLSQGLLVTALAWAGLIGTASALHAMFDGRSFKLWLIHNGHDLLSYLIMSVLLVLWR